MDASRTDRRAVALVLAVFVLGIALGALGTYLAGGRVWGARAEGRGSHEKHARIVEQLTKELALTPEQQKQLDAILADMRAEYQAIHELMNSQRDQVRQQGRDQIRAILTPEQRSKFEEFMRRLDEGRKKKDGR